MSPQFVDFDRDGRTDIVAATFDGSPYLSLGSAEGFRKPSHFLDGGGMRLLITEFWNYDAKKWDSTGRSMEKLPGVKGQCTSAVALDWDGDGDHDLLLGDYKNGGIYVQLNEGSDAKPLFVGENIPVKAGGKRLVMESGITTPRLVDWDGDGRTDLVLGTFGRSFGDGPGGEVVWLRNEGNGPTPVYSAPRTLLPVQEKGGDRPTGPDTGLYPEPVDIDGDGDLDLLVGGYTHWQRPAKTLTDAERARIPELEMQIEGDGEALAAMRTAALEGKGELKKLERRALIDAVKATAEYRRTDARQRAAMEELDILRPKPRRDPFVWLYRRIDAPASTD